MHMHIFKRIVSIAATIVMAAGLSAGLAAVPAHATVAGCANGKASVNLLYNNKWFWNNWNGTTVNGNHVNFNDVPNDGYNDWCPIVLGYVTNQAPVWPFPDGSGLNTRYNGRPVYKFCWQRAQSYCIDFGQYDQNVHNGRSIIYSNAMDNLYEVVQSSLGYWVPVWPNTLEFATSGGVYLPVLLGTQNNGPLTQGGGLWMNPFGNGLQFSMIYALVCRTHC
jgi:hypothetical protein